MKLKKYLAQFAIKQKDFARKIGVTDVAITNYCFGNRMPKPPVMRKIFDATGGLVDANSFYDLPSLLTPTGSAADSSAVGSDPSEGENAALPSDVCRPSDNHSDKREGQK